MPLSTVLPPQAIEYTQRFFGPNVSFNPGSAPGTVITEWERCGTRVTTALEALASNQLQNGGWAGGYFAAGSAAETRILTERLSRFCYLMSIGAGGTTRGSGARPPAWLPSFGPASSMAPGAQLLPDAVVMVWDWNVSINLAAATPGWADDTCPFMFLPVGGAHTVATAPIGDPGGNHIGGFGVFLNNDGAGGARYEYVSWSTGAPGSVLERVAVASSVVPDVADWNTVRFIIVGAASGREANVTVEVNGTTIVSEREFGSAVLQRPTAAVAGATGMAGAVAVRGTADDQLFWSWECKQGRFTPSGAELQAV